MKSIRHLYRWLTSRLLSFTARHQALVVAILSVIASTAASAAFTGKTLGSPVLALSALALLLLILAGLVPNRYAYLQLISSMLPVIHKLLKLKDSDRITIHFLRGSGRREKYEQLTEYYPPGNRSTRGRIFSFSHGIVGQCFKNNAPNFYSIPLDKNFVLSMKERWSFSEKELSQLTQDRRSFMVFPIGQEDYYAQAVLYLDSPDPNCFNETGFSDKKVLIQEYFLPQLKEALRHMR